MVNHQQEQPEGEPVPDRVFEQRLRMYCNLPTEHTGAKLSELRSLKDVSSTYNQARLLFLNSFWCPTEISDVLDKMIELARTKREKMDAMHKMLSYRKHYGQYYP